MIHKQSREETEMVTPTPESSKLTKEMVPPLDFMPLADESLMSPSPTSATSWLAESCRSGGSVTPELPPKVAFSSVQVRTFNEEDPPKQLLSMRGEEMPIEEFEAPEDDVFSPETPVKSGKRSIGKAAKRLRKFLMFGGGAKDKKVFSSNRGMLIDNDLQCTTKPLWQIRSTSDKSSSTVPQLRRVKSMGQLEMMDSTQQLQEALPQPRRFGSNAAALRQRSYSDMTSLADNRAINDDCKNKDDLAAMYAHSYC